jgi:hypothetical protein
MMRGRTSSLSPTKGSAPTKDITPSKDPELEREGAVCLQELSPGRAHLSEQLQQLHAQLEAKDQQLLMAAELGQSLLQQNQALLQEKDSLIHEFDGAAKLRPVFVLSLFWHRTAFP